MSESARALQDFTCNTSLRGRVGKFEESLKVMVLGIGRERYWNVLGREKHKSQG